VMERASSAEVRVAVPVKAPDKVAIEDAPRDSWARHAAISVLVVRQPARPEI